MAGEMEKHITEALLENQHQHQHQHQHEHENQNQNQNQNQHEQQNQQNQHEQQNRHTTAAGKEAGRRECAPGCGFSDEKKRAEDAAARTSAARKLGLATIFCLVFVAVEVAGGLMSNSLAILTDAAHLLSDVAGFAISLFAIWAGSWEATPRQSYGFFRLEILGALLSIQLIWLLTGIIVYEAIYRLIYAAGAVDGRLMFLVAAFGFGVNIVMVFLLGHGGHGHDHDGHDHGGHDHGSSAAAAASSSSASARDDDRRGHGHGVAADARHGQRNGDAHHHHHDDDRDDPLLPRRDSYKVDIDIDAAKGRRRGKAASSSKEENINVRGAWLHVIGDLIQSVGVMIGGAIIWARPAWQLVDLVCTLLFSALVLFTTARMLRDVVEILMESTPREVDVERLEERLLATDGVAAVHELHVWAITLGKTLLACHVAVAPDADADAVLARVIALCDRDFGIGHVTVQIERQRRRLPSPPPPFPMPVAAAVPDADAISDAVPDDDADDEEAASSRPRHVYVAHHHRH